MKIPFVILALVTPTLPAATLVGLWEFDDSFNLAKATVGNDLVFDGISPAYSASIADDSANSLSGVMTTVLGDANTISATHGIAPNGGGSFVNQYSIVADIFTPVDSRSSWRTLYQTNTGNTNDGEYFIRNDNDALGVGVIGYSSNPIDETVWTRFVLTVDLTQDGDDFVAYLDGSLFFTHPNDQSVDGRFSLDPSVLFFTDNDGDDAPLQVGALALYDGVLSPADVSRLGVAGTAIIPEPSTSSLLGLLSLALAIRRNRR